MDIVKLRTICKEIAKKLTPPRETVVIDNEEVTRLREFTPKELRFIGAHADLWYQSICDAMGIAFDEE